MLSLITGALKPWRGTRTLARAPFALLDQRVSLLDPALSIRDNFLALNPHSDENTCRAALARFMFRADAALQIVGTLSGGQLLRAGLACVLGVSPPPLLVLDEPTNHLDIDSIEAVEAGLRAYDGALLIVSHDETFLDAVGVIRRLRLKRPAPVHGHDGQTHADSEGKAPRRGPQAQSRAAEGGQALPKKKVGPKAALGRGPALLTPRTTP